jgi:Xaa-Pro aminopeptidase/Xaa-Pro dipeptidase
MIPAPITDTEHAQRIGRLREALDGAGLDGLIAYGAHRDYHPADLRYLARWYCVEEEQAALYVPRQGETVLLTDASWDVDRARAEAYADDMRLARDMGRDLAALVRESVDGGGARVGVAGYAVLPAPTYLALQAAAPGVELVDASDLTADLRMRKSPAELDLMRAASRISDRAMAAGLEQVRDGSSEVDVAAAAEAVIRQAGAEPSFVTEMGSGPRTALGTFLPGTRRLSAGELAVLDCGARVHGYHGDMCRTVVVGDPTDDQRRKLEAVDSAVTASIAAVKPGVTVGEIRDVAARAIADAGFGDSWWDAFMPHGNGAGQHEPPNAKEHPDQELAPGMVLCIEPGITVADEGAVIIEQMIAVTDTGAEVLNSLPTDMWARR